MAETPFKLFKSAYGATNATTLSNGGKVGEKQGTKGGIYFDTTSKSIYVGGVAFGGNITDVTLDNNILTISKAVGDAITLNFSDTASASATMKVFENIANVIGKDLNVTGDGHKDSLNYEGSNYLNGYVDGETTVAAVTTLVDADVRLDALIKAINDEIAGMNGTATIASATDGVVTIKAGVAQTDGKIEQGAGTDITLAKVATTGNADDVKTATVSGATYDVTAPEISDEWASVVNTNTLATTDTVEDSVEKLDNKIAGLADEVINNENVINNTFDAVKGSVGLEDDFSIDLSSEDLNSIKDKTSVKEALVALDGAIASASITIDGHKGAITTGNGLTDVTAESGSFGVKAKENGYISVTADGVDVQNVDTNGNSTTETDLATVKTVTEHINGLDVDTNIQAVDKSVNDTTGDVTLTFKGVNETDGVIEQGEGTDTLVLKKVATTGKAEDVSYDKTNNKVIKTATTVEDAIDAIDTELAALAGGMRYNGSLTNATATLNGKTSDIRPGDIYLASGAFTIGTMSVESGDMIVYKGEESTSTVTLTTENCNVIERENDLMVTADGTLTDSTIMLGAGNKSVKASTITADDLSTAMDNANSALQSIGKGTDGDYVTTTVSEKGTGTTQNVSTAVTVQPVSTSSATAKGLAEASDVKDYVDTQVATAIQSVDVSDDEKAKAVTADDYVNVKVTATTDTNKNVTLETVASLNMATVTDAGATTTDGVATATDARNIAKAEAASAIDALEGTATSDDNAVATVKVDTENGQVKDVTVTTIGAGVTYTPATTGDTPTAANLSATTVTGAVTGADVTAIKSYVDAKSEESAKVVDNAATITVNDTDATELATVGGQAITAKVQMTWEEWDD